MPYYPGAGQTWSNQFRKNYQVAYPVPLPFTYSNNFEGIPAGTTLSTANSGGVSGRAFDAVNVGTGTIVSDSSFAAHGITAAKITTSASTACTFRWNSFGGQYVIWFRFSFNAAAIPASNVRIFQTQTTNFNTPLLCAALQFTSAGKFSWINSPGSTIATTTNSIIPGQWVRLEGFIYGNATAGQTELKLFNNIESTTPLETITSSATNTADMSNAVLFGTNVGVANYGPLWFDDIGITNIGYMGPVTFPTFVPQLEAFPGPTWQKNYQHKQITYFTVPDAYVGAATANVNVAGQVDNSTVVSQSIAPPNVSVSGQSDNSLADIISGAVASVNVSGQSDNIVTELMPGQVANVNTAAASGSLLINVIGSISSVNAAAPSGVITETVLGSVSSVNVAGISGSILIPLTGTTGNVNVSAIAGIVGQQSANIIGSPASVFVMAPSGTVFKEPDGTWWRVYPAYRSYPT